MKNRGLLTLLLVSIIFISSCKKEEPAAQNNNTNNNTSGSYYFRCKIDGVSWNATIPTGTDTVFWGSTTYVIENKTGTAQNQLLISVMPFDATTWALESAVYVDNAFNMYDDNFVMTNLQLTVTRDSVNKIISGSFSFPLLNDFDMDTVKITNGEFRVKY